MSSKDIINDLVVKYKEQRAEAKEGQQLYAIPCKRNDMVQGQSFYYYIGDRRRTAVDFKSEICLHLNWVKFKDMPPGKYAKLQESMTPLEDLISANLVYPFLLFVNGRMVRWEYITLIATQERYDLLIKGMDQTVFDTYFRGAVKNAYVIMLPDSISYKQGGFEITSKTLFAFNELGELVLDGTAYTVIDNYDNSVSIINTIPSLPTFTFSQEIQYRYSDENIIVFNNNLFFGDCVINNLGPQVCINNNTLGASDHFAVKIFFNKKMGTPGYDHINLVSLSTIENDVYNYLSRGRTYPYLEVLKRPFNITMDREELHDQNVSNALEDIARYDLRYLSEFYMSQRDFMISEVDYAWVLSHRNDDGYLSIPRRLDDVDCYIIVLVNGELYRYYKNHTYEDANFICPIDGMKDGDVIELWYFKNVENYEIQTVVKRDDPFLPLDTDIYDENTRIFSAFTQDTYFSYPVFGNQHFPVDYTYEYNEDNSGFRIRFDNAFYYGMSVTICSSNRFKYWGAEVEDTGDADGLYQFDLGTAFMYCNDYDRFLVFYNGRRLANNQYRMVLPVSSGTPFMYFKIYTDIPFVVGDRIDVFYLPHHLNDVYSGTLTSTGLIALQYHQLQYMLDARLYSVWVNGKHIPMSDIRNITSTSIQVMTDPQSTSNLRVTAMITDKDEYEELKRIFQNIDSDWDLIITIFGDYPRLLGFRTPTVTDTEAPFVQTELEGSAVMRELVRDQYMVPFFCDTSGPFVCDYDGLIEFHVDVDPAGNYILDAADGNIETNLDVERPTH